MRNQYRDAESREADDWKFGVGGSILVVVALAAIGAGLYAFASVITSLFAR